MGNTVLLTDPDGGKVPDALRAFLVRDPIMPTVGRVRWQPLTGARPRPGELGTAIDVLTLVVTSLIALPSAIDVVRKWCSSPGQTGSSVVLSVGEVTVTVTAASAPDEIAAMAAALTTALRADGDGDSTTDDDPS
ncbi:hypothetical protein BN159_0705 [Streptomyces davaonensis JCM 4913]|uniref:Uncharacterized protein n=1 Tax=Streptomyces davaonensis (strain DSM 101723 / JCM 4913 / KCC S-0913 / 768) TaxID=1214101 RepID=K4QXI1_STRDJ|nr:hypothetical protein [Streptomyces davaonensis]CCK25084.1 hypothetical protein BN159_0705 [Streptomyces davaonensis JCM 4913]